MTYQVTSFVKYAEVDVFEEGCIPGTASNLSTTNVRFEDELSTEVLRRIMEFFDVDRDAVELDVCETPGRIDVQRMETNSGEPPTEDQILLWKLGKWTLWSVTYIGQLEHFGPAEWTLEPKKVFKTEGGR